MDTVFHIGYHKTATSWLQRKYLACHPDIRVISNSAKPWDDPLVSYLIQAPDGCFNPGVAQERLSEVRTLSEKKVGAIVDVVSAERLSGHPFSGGYDGIRNARRIAAAFPSARVLIVVRDPVDALNSIFKQMVVEGYPGTLQQLLEQKPWKTACFTLDYFDYDRLVGEYFRLFGRGRVCVLRYEGLREDRLGFLEALCKFLGVEVVMPDIADERVYPSLPDMSIQMIRRLNYFHKTELYPFPVWDLGRLYGPLRRVCVGIGQRMAGRDRGEASRELPPEVLDRFNQARSRLKELLEESKS